MISYDEFSRIAKEELYQLPEYVHEGLNGGVLTDPAAYPHPARLADDLYIMGTYSVDPGRGKQIVLYYGSFTASLGEAGEKVYREQIRETVRHEFLHHLETRAGLFGKNTLVEEDRERMMKYFIAAREKTGQSDDAASAKSGGI